MQGRVAIPLLGNYLKSPLSHWERVRVRANGYDGEPVVTASTCFEIVSWFFVQPY